MAIGTQHGVINLANPSTLALMHRPLLRSYGPITALAFSADGYILASR
jgi:hypothetical protein